MRDGERKSLAPWTAVPLLVGCLGLAAVEVQPLEQHYQAARTALARGDTAKAKRELKLSLQEKPLDAQSHFLLALLLAREGDLDQAIVGFQRTTKIERNNAEARYNLGTALLWRGEPVSAARLLEDAISLRPDYVPSYNNLAKAYFLAGLPDLAVASYKEALRRDPSNAIALKSLALLTVSAGVQDAPGASDTNTPAMDAGEPKKTITPAAEAPAISDAEREAAGAQALREVLSDLPHVTVDRRGGRLTLAGWTSSTNEQKMVERILAGQTNVLNLTTDDVGDPHRLLEVDATLFRVLGLDSLSVGHNFLNRVTVNASLADAATAGFSWLYSAAISYDVNIANAANERVAVLARPHLTALSGTLATFIAGGEIVYQVTGNIGGNIAPYPFGTVLDVTPTLLRTRGEDGSPLVHLTVKAGRKNLLPLEDIGSQGTGGGTLFEHIEVTSEAVLGLNQTLILTGLSQRETRIESSGVPGLKSIPIIKYLFSNKTTVTSELAIIILLTPRDPAYWDEENQKAMAEFVAKRRAYVQATHGTAEDMRRFKERYPDWNKLAPNRFASHFFLMDNSAVYRAANGMDLANENLDFDLLGKAPKNKAKQ